MKRTPLRRKTPLRASSNSSKPRPRLASASTKQATRLQAYRQMLADWQGRQGRRVCAACGTAEGLEAHHPFGRGGDNLFKVVLLCHACHSNVHAHPDLAYSQGWLQPEYRAVRRPDGFPTPWRAGELIRLPDKKA